MSEDKFDHNFPNINVSTIQLSDQNQAPENPEILESKIEIGSHILNIVEEENTTSQAVGDNSNPMSSRFNGIKPEEPSFKSAEQQT